MKRIFRGLISLLLVISLVGCGAGNGGTESEKKEYSVENFTVYDMELNEVELEDYIGKPIVLNFWATWCYYCKIEMPDFNEAYKNHPEIQFMMVNYTDGKNETVEKAKAYIESEGYEFPVFFDTELMAAEKYGVSAFPTTFFISAEGELLKTQKGAMSAEKLEKYIRLFG